MRLLFLLALTALGCNESAASAPDRERKPTASRSVPSSPRTGDGPLRVETVPGADPPIFALQGGPRGPGRIVFLHGMCGHGLGYAQSFQHSAAVRGTLIAPQADVSCGGVWSKWSADTEKLDARIVDTFRRLGHADPIDDILVIGMSQGATRAVALVKKWPQRYTRLISMAAPSAIQPGELRGLRGAVMMAGERDRQDLMRKSQQALERSGVPVTFVLIPEATHGAMGPTPEKTMEKAFSFLDRLPAAAQAGQSG